MSTPGGREPRDPPIPSDEAVQAAWDAATGAPRGTDPAGAGMSQPELVRDILPRVWAGILQKAA